MAMKLAFMFVLATLSHAEVTKTNPLSSVISLLNDLKAKVGKEGAAEDKAYEEFTAWCKDAVTTKGFEIKTATSSKESLEATIKKAESDTDVAVSKIQDRADSIAVGDAELKKASTLRESETSDFQSTEAELADVIDTLGRAIITLSREMQKNPAAFAQIKLSASTGNLIKALGALVDAAAFSAADKEKLLAMVQAQQKEDSEDDDLGAPTAAVYSTHSNNIVEVLEDLKEKAEEQLVQLRKAETNARHNFEMLSQSLVDQNKADQKDLDDARLAKSAAMETKATGAGDLANTEKDLASAKDGLETANQHCLRTAQDHDASVQARAEELKVIDQALKILSDSTAGAEQQSYSLLQLNGASVTSSRLQSRADLANLEVVNLIKRLAAEQHSTALAQLASRIAAVVRYGATAGQDPFTKVRQLIEGLISRLEKEAGGDATEKAYCDDQLSQTAEKQAELNHDISKLTSKIDKAEARSATLKSEVHEAQADLAHLAKEQSDLDSMRKETHTAYVQAKADLELGVQGVRRALTLLREYYGPAALAQESTEASALVQQPAVPSYHAQAGGAGTSIIGILEVVESDFARNLATEETQEDDAASEYDSMTQKNKMAKTVKTQDVTYKTKEFKGLDKSLTELNSDRSSSDTELDAVMEYDSTIKARCIAKPETYEERKGRRVAEIAGLKEALSILEEETAFVQHRKHGFAATTLG